MTTGVKVVLCYRKICDNLPEQAHLPPKVHAIHIEVDKMTPQIQRESIGLVFSPKTKEFPVGIKMRLVPEISTSTDHKVRLQAKQRQALQARFLAISATRLLLDTPHPDYNKHRTMATLRRFLLHNSLPTPPECHLFYAVSPSTQSDKFIVRFLPQHQTKVDQIIPRLVKKLPGVQVSSIAPQTRPSPSPSPLVQLPPLPRPSKPAPKLEPTIASQQEALNKVFKWRFTVATESSQTILKSSFNCNNPIHPCIQAFPSKYKLDRWRRALQQLLQNTAWDRWRYQLGISEDLRDPVTLAPCNELVYKPPSPCFQA